MYQSCCTESSLCIAWYSKGMWFQIGSGVLVWYWWKNDYIHTTWLYKLLGYYVHVIGYLKSYTVQRRILIVVHKYQHGSSKSLLLDFNNKLVKSVHCQLYNLLQPPVVNQRTGNSHYGIAMDAFMRESILISESVQQRMRSCPNYHKTSNKDRTKSQNPNVSRIIM